MPTGEYRILRSRGVDLAAACITDFYFLRAGRVAQVLHAHGRAVQADADWRTGVVEVGVVRLCQNNI